MSLLGFKRDKYHGYLGHFADEAVLAQGHNPLTKKGKKILRSMRKQYGERAEEVLYASAKEGTIKGVHK